MTTSVIFEKENPLFHRKEFSLAFESKVTPSKDEAVKLIAGHFKVGDERVRLRKVDGSFGSNVFKIIGDVYDTKEDLDRIVKKTKQEIEAEKKAKEEKMKAEVEAKEAAEAEKVKVIEPEEKEESKEALAPESVSSEEGKEGKE